MVLVERTHDRRLDGEVARTFELIAGQQPQGRLVNDGLRRRREAPALGQQPGLEGLRVGDGHPVEEVLPEPWELERLIPVAVDQHVDVERRPGRQRQLYGVAIELGCRAEAPSHLGEAPAERT